MTEKGDLVLPRSPLITHPRGTGLNLTRGTRAPPPIPAETPTDPSLTPSLTLEEARDPGLHQNPPHILEVDRSPDLVPSQGTIGQHQNPPKEQPLS